jgi:hypothetical protein
MSEWCIQWRRRIWCWWWCAGLITVGAILDYLDDFWLCWRRCGWHLCKQCISCYMYKIVTHGLTLICIGWERSRFDLGLVVVWWSFGLLLDPFLITLTIFDWRRSWEVTSVKTVFLMLHIYPHFICNDIIFEMLWEVKGLAVVFWVTVGAILWYFDDFLGLWVLGEEKICFF